MVPTYNVQIVLYKYKDYDLHSVLTRQIGYFGSFKAIYPRAKGKNSV